MPVKHSSSVGVLEGTKGGTTGCGVNTQTQAIHWVDTSARITYAKNGCKN